MRFESREGCTGRHWLGALVLATAAACATGSDQGSASDASIATPDGNVADASFAEGSADASADASVDASVDAPPDVLDELGSADAQDGDAPPVGCPTGQILCGSTCVDPSSNPNHCGNCNTVCSSGVCGTTLSADMSAQPANWTFNGSAVWDSAGPSARLTKAMTDLVAGSVVYNHPIVTDSFNASFQFRIGANGGGQYDGMGFMIEVNGPTAVGSNGGGLGMTGLGGYGVELDIYNNGRCSDSNANHVGIDQLTDCGNGMPTSLFASPDLTGTVTLYDAQWHTATVYVAGGAMSVTVDGHPVASNVTLTGFVPGTSYYYGFAGAIGGGSSSFGMQTEVKGVTVTFPSPRCL